MRVGQVRKRDTNERAIVAALGRVGVQCLRISDIGAPDVLAYSPRTGFRLLEVKTKRGRLTAAQQDFSMPFTIVRTVDEALELFEVKR